MAALCCVCLRVPINGVLIDENDRITVFKAHQTPSTDSRMKHSGKSLNVSDVVPANQNIEA